MAADPEGSFQLTRFKIYGLLFDPGAGVNDAGDDDGRKKEKWASIPTAKDKSKRPGGAKPGKEEEEEEEDYDDEEEYEESEEEYTEYTYEVIELSDSDDDDVKIIDLEHEDVEEIIHVYYDDDLFTGFKVTLSTTAQEIVSKGQQKLHLKSNAVQFSLFIIKNGTDIRRLHNDEKPLIRMRRYKDMDIKFAFLSTMSSFNMKMRNECFKGWLFWKLAEAAPADGDAEKDKDKDKQLSRMGDPTDLGNGVLLIDLLRALNISPTVKFVKKPKRKREKISNIRKALRTFLEAGCIIPEHVTPEQLFKGNPVAYLDLLWSIIYRAHAPLITDSSMEFVFMDELLYWCLDQVRDYEGIDRKNIHNSLCNGLAWCALVHKHDNDALNFQMACYAATKLSRKNSETCKLAFDAAEKSFGLPRLIHPKYFDGNVIDELSIIIYLACWHNRFTQTGPLTISADVPVETKDGKKRKEEDKKRLAEEKRKEQERSQAEKRQEELRRRQEEAEQKLDEERRKEQEKIDKAKRKEKERLEKKKRKLKGGEKLAAESMVIPVFFQGFDDDFVTFRTYQLDKYASVKETYEVVAKDIGMKQEEFAFIQRKKGADQVLLEAEERLLFKDKEKGEKYMICCKRTALKPEQLEAAKKLKK